MEIKLYTCGEVDNTLTKNPVLVETISGPDYRPNQAIELMNPSINIKMTHHPDEVNYANIDGRWYYILDWVMVNVDSYMFNFHLDVLMTYKDSINSLDVILERAYQPVDLNEDMRLHDPMIPIYPEQSVQLTKSPTEFDFSEEAGTYLMVVSQAGYDAIGEPTGPPATPDVYGPRIGASTLGAYILDKEKLFALAQDLNVTELLEKLAYALVGNPADAIITLHWLPGIESLIDKSEVDVNLKLGNFSFSGELGSQIVTKAAVDEQVTLSLGSFSIFPTLGYKSYLDYGPYTRAELYLPFYGMVQIAPELYQGLVQVYYTINIVTRVCVISLYKDSDVVPTSTPVEQFTTTFGDSIPFTTQSNEDMLSRLATMVSGAAIATATFATAPVGPAVAGAALSTSNALRTAPAVENLVSQVNPSNLPSQDRSISVGGMDSSSGLLASPAPILRVTRAIIPDDYRQPNSDIFRAIGHPNYSLVKVSSLTGYFKISGLGHKSLGPPTMVGTVPRFAWDEIIKLLKDGVYK